MHIFAHLAAVSLPSKPPFSRASTLHCRSFRATPDRDDQNASRSSTSRTVCRLRSIDPCRAPRNQTSQAVTSFRSLLRLLQFGVVRFPVRQDEAGHAVEPARAPVATCQQQLRQGASDASVTVVKRMDGQKPQMGQSRLQQRLAVVLVEPTDELVHERGQLLGVWRREMHRLSSMGPLTTLIGRSRYSATWMRCKPLYPEGKSA